jgi:hypothetical protein
VILIFNLFHRVTTTKKTVFKLEQCLGEDMLLYRMEKNGLCCKKRWGQDRLVYFWIDSNKVQDRIDCWMAKQLQFRIELNTLSWNNIKGTQDWDLFWLRFWNLYYFFISYVKILRFYQKIFDQAIMGGDTISPLSLRLS